MTVLDVKPSVGSIAQELSTRDGLRTHGKRLAACVLGGLVLALMVGNQEGTQDDFHIAFHEAVLEPRVFVFIAIGVVVYLLMTFWPLVVPFLGRPGIQALTAGLLAIIAAQTVMNWYDPLVSRNGDGKFRSVSSALDGQGGLAPYTAPFFSYLGWALAAAAVVLTGAEIVLRRRIGGYLAAVVGVAGAVVAFLAHRDVLAVGGGVDHSLGMFVDVIGFATLAAAGLTASLSRTEVADTRGFLTRVMEYRPGLVLLVGAFVWGLLAFTTFGWFYPSGASLNDTLSDASRDFKGTGVNGLTSLYLGSLGWILFAICVVLAAVAVWLRNEIVAWAAALAAFVSVIITFLVLKDMTTTAAKVVPQYGTSWKNLGAGGFIACIVFSLIGAAMAQTLSAARAARATTVRDDSPKLPITALIEGARRSANMRAVLIVGVAVAVFYPPTLPVTWQNVLVTQIGPYVLLAIGLNVVVGWAGLLDLGYIAFYEIGSYTTAYLTGSLPIKPPHFLHPFSSPLWAIPFAVAVCLLAGVLLGGPTLRLRGDYLAIVTLGFGEIIQQIANNSTGFTGGPQGPTVPHPDVNFLGLHITWGQDNLPYWYLLLVMLVIVLALFYRLEGSRIGRAWAAIREDEVAAQASGVNTTRVKLLAFAIGASTSGLAGVFFATQVGYFDPSLFTLQASILIVAYVVFGGMGSLYGAMAGAAVLTWLPQFLKDQVPANDRQMWVGALVLAMMIFRPAGLLPARRRRAELEGLDSPLSAEVSAVPSSEGL